MLKNWIKKTLRKRGLILSPYDPHLESVKLVENNWLMNQNIDIVIDVGASTGGYSRKISKIIKDAEIYSFEALPDSYKKLIERNKDLKNFYAVNTILSETEGEVDFYECVTHTGSSSLLEMSDILKSGYTNDFNNRLIKLKSTTLDNYFKNKNILNKKIILKIDVQGAELIVLKGGVNLLKSVHLVYCEINFSETYNGCVLFADIYAFMVEHGFQLKGIENVSKSIKNGDFLQADAYFVKN